MKTRRLLLIISIPVFLLIGGVIWAYFYFSKEDPDYLIHYIQKKPEQVAFFISYNGEEVVKRQPDLQMPLASTMKIIVAMEYAYQVAEGKIDPQEKVPLAEVGHFYLEDTDGGAHLKWLEEISKKGVVDSKENVPLHEVAKGMITYSSNANADYLMDRLDLDNVNKRIEKLDLKNHQPLYPITASMLIPDFIQHQQDDELSDEEMINRLDELSIKEYRSLVEQIHEQLKEDTYPNKEEWVAPPPNIQQVWSDRLPASNVEDYGWMMQRISQRDYFPTKVQEILEDLMKWPMELHPENKKHFKHLGGKGGSTVFILNQALYGEDHKGNKIEIVFLSNQKGLIERLKVRRNFDTFLFELLHNDSFRERVVKELQ